MTTNQVQRRRGTASQCDAMTPAVGEVVVDTTNNRQRIGDGSRAGGFTCPNFSDIQKQAFGFGNAGGTADALTLTLSPALLAYANGVAVEFKATANNTGGATLNVNGLGNATVLKMKDGALVALEADDIVNGGIYRAVHDGTQFQLQYTKQQSSTTSGLVLLDTQTGSTINFVSVIDSTYDIYRLEFTGISGSTVIQLSTNNGSSYLTGTNYFQKKTTDWGGATFDTSASGWNIGAAIGTSSGSAVLSGVNDSGSYTKKIKVSSVGTGGGTDNIYSFDLVGTYTPSIGAVNAIRLSNAGGGTASIYGVAK